MEFAGTIYKNGNRYWWKVTFSGKKKPDCISGREGNDITKYVTVYDIFIGSEG